MHAENMTKLDKKFFNEQTLVLYVNTYMELCHKLNKTTDWNKFIRTKQWVDIHSATTEMTRQLFKSKWEETEVDFRCGE